MPRRDTKKAVAAWIARGLAKEGKTQNGLGEALGLPQPRVWEMKVGRRRLQVHELPLASSYLEEPIPPEIIPDGPLVTEVPILTWVSAGKLTRNDIADAIVSHMSIGGLSPKGDWIGLIVEGDSMDRISPPNSIIVVNRKDKKLAPNACYVIDDGEGNATYKRYRPGPPPRFEAVSTAPGHEPIYYDNEPVIIGRVVRTILDM